MITRIGVIFFTIPCIILLTLYGMELSAATDCQKLNLYYDAFNQTCVESQPEFSSFYMRNTYLVNILLLVSTIGAFALIVGMVQDKKARQQK